MCFGSMRSLSQAVNAALPRHLGHAYIRPGSEFCSRLEYRLMSFEDLWLARDKVEHFSCCAGIHTWSYQKLRSYRQLSTGAEDYVSCSCRLSDIPGSFVPSSLCPIPSTSISTLQCAGWIAKGSWRLSSGKLRCSLQYQFCRSFDEATHNCKKWLFAVVAWSVEPKGFSC